jgi:hypothetical protein
MLRAASSGMMAAGRMISVMSTPSMSMSAPPTGGRGSGTSMVGLLTLHRPGRVPQ